MQFMATLPGLLPLDLLLSSDSLSRGSHLVCADYTRPMHSWGRAAWDDNTLSSHTARPKSLRTDNLLAYGGGGVVLMSTVSCKLGVTVVNWTT